MKFKLKKIRITSSKISINTNFKGYRFEFFSSQLKKNKQVKNLYKNLVFYFERINSKSLNPVKIGFFRRPGLNLQPYALQKCASGNLPLRHASRYFFYSLVETDYNRLKKSWSIGKNLMPIKKFQKIK